MHPYLSTLKTLRKHVELGDVTGELAVQLLREEQAQDKPRSGALALLVPLADTADTADDEADTADTADDEADTADTADDEADTADTADDEADEADEALQVADTDGPRINHIRLRRAVSIPTPNGGRHAVKAWMPRGEYRGEIARHVYLYAADLCDVLD